MTIWIETGPRNRAANRSPHRWPSIIPPCLSYQVWQDGLPWRMPSLLIVSSSLTCKRNCSDRTIGSVSCARKPSRKYFIELDHKLIGRLAGNLRLSWGGGRTWILDAWCGSSTNRSSWANEREIICESWRAGETTSDCLRHSGEEIFRFRKENERGCKGRLDPVNRPIEYNVRRVGQRDSIAQSDNHKSMSSASRLKAIRGDVSLPAQRFTFSVYAIQSTKLRLPPLLQPVRVQPMRTICILKRKP